MHQFSASPINYQSRELSDQCHGRILGIIGCKIHKIIVKFWQELIDSHIIMHIFGFQWRWSWLWGAKKGQEIGCDQIDIEWSRWKYHIMFSTGFVDQKYIETKNRIWTSLLLFRL
jgi:hypothetical protein